MDMLKLREKQAEISVYDMAKIIFEYFKRDRRQSAYDEPKPFESMSVLYNRFFLHQPSGCSYITPHQHTQMKFYEAFYLLQRQGLITPMEDRRYVLTGLGYESDFDENGDILILDDAEEKVQSIRDEVCSLDPIVEEFYRESIRAFQEGLTLASIFCLGAAIERIFYNLADAVTNYEKSYRSKFGQTWGNTTMKDKVKKLNSWFSNIKENNPPSDPRFIVLLDKLFDKLEDMAKWYGITRNENIHTAYKESPFPEPRAIEIKILDFRLYAITIFQIIDSLQP